MKQSGIAIWIFVLVFTTAGWAFAQSDQRATAAQNYAVEVTYYKGRQLAYLRIGQGAWYGLFQRIDEWKLKTGELPINAVRILTRDEGGVVKARVSVLRGPHLEVEDFVAEHALSDKASIIADLTNFGVVPFELKLVRAPSTVAELPSIVNGTRSLLVSAEAVEAPLPSFTAKILNTSTKRVAGFGYRTLIDGVTKISGIQQRRDGLNLFGPGVTYLITLPYPVTQTVESTGEVPQARTGLQFELAAVMFEDGTFEGDSRPAGMFRAYKVGEKIQLSRILNLLQSPAATSPEALAAKVNELKAQITIADVTPMAALFPGFTEANMQAVRASAESSASAVQKEFKAAFGGGTTDPAAFAESVKAATTKYEKWLKSLPLLKQ